MPVLNLFCTHHFFIFKSDVIAVFFYFCLDFWSTEYLKNVHGPGIRVFLLHGFILHASLFTRKR